MAFESQPITFEEFVSLVRAHNPHADFAKIEKAYRFAEKAHKGQKRAAGEDFFIHPSEVARILIQLKADTATICAALLHDTVEDTSTSLDTVRKEFGSEVTDLVEGVTKITGQWFESKEEYKAENLRKILLATTKDVRVIMIRLADRLHNMRTLATFRSDKRRRIAQETMEIYAPIAHKFGMWKLKGELEDLSFRYLDYDTYVRLKEKIAEKRAEREKATIHVVDTIRSSLAEKSIDAEVVGRAKYFFSIYKKMIKKQKDFDQIHDLIAIRIVVNTIPECYRSLEIIHTLFEPQLERFKDYIQHPKANGYQSIHTSVKYKNKVVEVQIRTHEMHAIAEEGVAAHWRYKGTEKDKAFDRKIMWLRQILEWLRKSKNATEFVETLKIDLFENEIIVLTPKGDPISLPEGATTVDFAYAVHTSIGNHCSKAKVNDRIEPLDYRLNSGDVVEIVTQNNAKPSRNWLNFVVTSKAKSKIRSYLGLEFDYRTREMRKEETKEEPRMPLQNYILVEGKKAPIRISKCCELRLGDPIVGLYTKDGKITVHKTGCVNIHSVNESKRVSLSWAEPEDQNIRKLRVYVSERPGILADLLNLLATEKVNVKSVNTRVKKKKIMLTFKIESKDESAVKDIAEKLGKIKDVSDIKFDDEQSPDEQ
ncbi:bifunctional (p)ppGpp synthetase/guanosine-3',5'-bis(diphosphate) 3'-pyrophosphohydrolase [Candidatus Woesearchaeota archaeon]|nr:bifunctional (p)ppGpp synthetase/guanosine-3',5'-bis(diphosphate) 3'-pyrophosphohydrolase [Candidatus Woesearchaeota archaeon]